MNINEEMRDRILETLDDAWHDAGNNGPHPLAVELRALPVPCENDGDGREHYAMGHRIEVRINPFVDRANGEFQIGTRRLCTKCCDHAKACGYIVKNA